MGLDQGRLHAPYVGWASIPRVLGISWRVPLVSPVLLAHTQVCWGFHLWRGVLPVKIIHIILAQDSLFVWLAQTVGMVDYTPISAQEDLHRILVFVLAVEDMRGPMGFFVLPVSLGSF